MQQENDHSLGSISHPVKLVIWDLDDTFWRGTLSEGRIEAIPTNVEMVRQLAQRGIVSSICSRNEFAAAEAELRRQGIWDYFVFPAIQWSPKGEAIRGLIELANLRAENVLFLDNEPSNLEEAAHYNPGIMCFDARLGVGQLWEYTQFAGTPDDALSRLKQYQVLQRKQSARAAQGLSNVEFLRGSQIRVQIEYEIDGYMDRIVALFNRANQLNFTKSRLQTEEEFSEFKRQLGRFGFKAGVVLVQDKYGDYGVAGFFMLWRAFKDAGVKNYLFHFVFSCRVMNMGVEQYVYEYLGRPVIDLKLPIANPICSFEDVNWITAGSRPEDGTLLRLRDRRMLLLGNCEMLQVGSYCSTNCVEFVARACGELTVRYDDPFFVLTNPHAIASSRVMTRLPSWNAQEIRDFDREIRNADALVFQWFAALSETYFRFEHDLVMRLHPGNLELILKSEHGSWFVRNCALVNYSVAERLTKLSQAMASIMERVRPDALVFLLGQTLQGSDYSEGERAKRKQYNATLRELGRSDARIHVVDPDTIARPEWIMDGWHFTREAYFEFAKHIGEIIDEVTIPPRSEQQPADVAGAIELNTFMTSLT